MEYRIPQKGEIYRHFKGNLYEIVIIARDSETLEEKVVYKEVEGDAVYVRSLSMFVSYVDKEKYPNATQKFRFELVKEADCVQSSIQKESELLSERERNYLADKDMIMAFLDLSTATEKIDYLQKVKDKITDNFIGIVAQSLDFVENEGSLYERYYAILGYLRTIARYERRFR